MEKVSEDIDKRSVISDDGKQFLVRIPVEVSMYMGIEAGDTIRFYVKKPTEQNPKPELVITYEVDKNGRGRIQRKREKVQAK